MRKPGILITGANGEVGHGLLEHFFSRDTHDVITIDINPLDKEMAKGCAASIVGDILDENLLQRLVSEYEIHEIYHLAALLSTRAEYTPDSAHRVNVDGTLNLLQLAHEQSRWHGNTVKFIFPSSIAAYGIPDRATKDSSAPVKETEFNFPITMYGCNKLYCENLGRYYSLHYRQLAVDAGQSGVDFRAVRFPGLISADTVPSGGTTDYGPEMIHAAAKGERYSCFVDAEAESPFMAMPDAIRALILLAQVPSDALTQRVYNVTSFSMTAEQIKNHVKALFPDAEIEFEPDIPRTRILDSWPGKLDDSPARNDWNWKPELDANHTFNDYLFPRISARYK